tara:strand:+ start:7652 stop:8038 length:387 start_codon:yes stop_codon:yes gene_type:complete
MANELQVSTSIQYDKNNHQLTFTPETIDVTVSGDQSSGAVLEATTTSAGVAIDVTEVGTSSQGWAWFRNIGTDSSTHIAVGPRDGSGTFIETFNLKGGEFAIMRLGDQQLYAKSSSGTLNLQYNVLEA